MGGDPGALLGPASRRASHKRDVALRSLKARIRGDDGEDGHGPVQVKILALPPEDLLVCLAARLGWRQMDRLFGACRFLDFLRRCPGPLDGRRIADVARRYGAAPAVCAELLLAEGVMDDGLTIAEAAKHLDCTAHAPRVLKLARHDDEAWGRYTAFRGIYFYLLTLLSLRGTRARVGTVLRSLLGWRGTRPVLPGLVRDLVTGTFSRMGMRRRGTSGLAYWAESGWATETAPQAIDEHASLRQDRPMRR